MVLFPSLVDVDLQGLGTFKDTPPRAESSESAPVRLLPPPYPNRMDRPYAGTILYQGISILVEVAKHGYRRGVHPDGTGWKTRMPAHYGEIPNTRGTDGEPVDVIVGSDANAPVAYVIHQKVAGTQIQDEDKIVLGCRSASDASALYRACTGHKEGLFGGVTPWPVQELREYLQDPSGYGKRLDNPVNRPGLGSKNKFFPMIKGVSWAAKHRLCLDSGKFREGMEALLKGAGSGIKGREGMVLAPTLDNPRIRRWRRIVSDEALASRGATPLRAALGEDLYKRQQVFKKAPTIHLNMHRWISGALVGEHGPKEKPSPDVLSYHYATHRIHASPGWRRSPDAGELLHHLANSPLHNVSVIEEGAHQGTVGELAKNLKTVAMKAPELGADGKYRHLAYHVRVMEQPQDHDWYHATLSRNVGSIKEQGLQPSGTASPEEAAERGGVAPVGHAQVQKAVYLTADPEYAQHMAQGLAARNGEAATVLKVSGKALDHKRLAIDEDALFNKYLGGFQSHEGTGSHAPAFMHSYRDPQLASVAHLGKIAPEHIEEHASVAAPPSVGESMKKGGGVTVSTVTPVVPEDLEGRDRILHEQGVRPGIRGTAEQARNQAAAWGLGAEDTETIPHGVYGDRLFLTETGMKKGVHLAPQNAPHLFYDAPEGHNEALRHSAQKIVASGVGAPIFPSLGEGIQRPADLEFASLLWKAECRASIPMVPLLKATISTPKTNEGKVDYDAVPVGASVWVTVTDPHSPLHGRPILIAKRPDHTFGLIGGAGSGHIQARRHLVLNTGRAQSTGKDEARLKEQQEIEARNAPKKEQIKEIRKQAKALRADAAEAWMGALGIRQKYGEEQRSKLEDLATAHARAQGLEEKDAAQYGKFAAAAMLELHEQHRQQLAQKRLKEAQAIIKGAAPDEVKALHGEDPKAPEAHLPAVTPEGWASLSPAEREHSVKHEIHAEAAQVAQASQEALGEDRFEAPAQEGPDPEAPPTKPAELGTPYPNPEPMAPGTGEAIAPPGQESTPEPAAEEPEKGPAIQLHPEGPISQEAAQKEDVKPSSQLSATEDAEEPPPIPEAVTLGNSPPIAPAPTPSTLPPLTQDQARRALEAFRAHAATHAAEKEALDSLERLPAEAVALPTSVEDLRLRAGNVSDDELDQFLNQHLERALHPGDTGFYEAISGHWNEADGNQLSGAASRGAASALSAIAGEGIHGRLDVARLVDSLGPEAAAAAVVQHVRGRMDAAAYGAWVDKIQAHNKTNQAETEKKALQRHRDLVAQNEHLQRQTASGDLSSEATIATLQAHNLLEQRENLGTALGSLQASAALYHYAERALTTGTRKQPIAIQVGHKAAVDDKLKRLGRFSHELKYEVNPGGYAIHTDTRALGKYVKAQVRDEGRAEKWRAIKENRDGLEADAQGREWATDYSLPNFRSTFPDSAVLPVEQKAQAGKPIRLSGEQRNNIEWLHGAGGGLVSMRTGGGKTLVSTGIAAKMLAENPEGRHLRVVPNGREDQWAQEIRTFTNLNPVVLPAGSNRDERHKLLKSAPAGSVVVVGHNNATRAADVDALGQHSWDSIGIDEPQELRSKSGNGKLSAGAARLFKLPARNRHALTATPATDHPVEAYDIVNWASPKALGHRTRFKGAFSGIGAGTHAQAAALASSLHKELEPHISGDAGVTPHYAVQHVAHTVTTSDSQRQAQRQIEAGTDARVGEAVQTAYTRKKEGKLGYAHKSYQELRADATQRTQRQIGLEHRANLSGGDAAHNPKLAQMIKTVGESKPDEKHVVFVDDQAQRAAVVSAMETAGRPTWNITESAKGQTNKTPEGEISAVENRKRKWKESKGGVLVIDRTSASGHNLAEGQHLHILGSPDDAAQLLQVHGRLGRANREGDFNVHTYRYGDNPFEHATWNKLDRQLGVLKATAPGLFVEGKKSHPTRLILPLRLRLRKGGAWRVAVVAPVLLPGDRGPETADPGSVVDLLWQRGVWAGAIMPRIPLQKGAGGTLYSSGPGIQSWGPVGRYVEAHLGARYASGGVAPSRPPRGWNCRGGDWWHRSGMRLQFCPASEDAPVRLELAPGAEPLHKAIASGFASLIKNLGLGE